MFYLLQHKVWSALEKDPLFAHHPSKPPLKDYRLLTLKRVKKLMEYNFMPLSSLLERPKLV